MNSEPTGSTSQGVGSHHHAAAPLKPLNPAAIEFESRSTPPPQFAGVLQPQASSSTPQSFTLTGRVAVPPGAVIAGVYGPLGVDATPQGSLMPGGAQWTAGTPLSASNSMIDDVSTEQFLLRQQQQQQAAAAAAEREFVYTRSIIPHVARPALVAVLTSLLDDFPHLAPVIHYRCDKAMAAVAQQEQRLYSQQGNAGSSAGGTPWASQSGNAGGDISPQQQHMVPPGAVTPPSQQRRHSSRGGAGAAGGPQLRHRDDEQQELCVVHGNFRPLKHLVFRPAHGNYECVHGFHCLESSNPPSHSTTPQKDAHGVGAHLQSYMQAPPLLSSAATHGAAPFPASHPTAPSALGGSPHMPAPLHGASLPSPIAEGASSKPEDVDVLRLQNLLNNVRQVHQLEEN